MASPVPILPMSGGWNGYDNRPPAAAAPEYAESGLQVRPMGRMSPLA